MRFRKIEIGTYQVLTMRGYIGTVYKLKWIGHAVEWKAVGPGYSMRGFQTRQSAADALARNDRERAFKNE